MVSILTEIVELMVSGITGIAEGVGTGLSTLAESIFLTTVGEVTTLSTFGSLIVIFAGVSLAIGLSKWVCSFVTGFGKN